MASIFDGIDMSDPCAVWPKLQEVLDRLLAGEMSVMARFGQDERRWQGSDVRALTARIAQLKSDCAAKQTGSPGRRVFRAGFRSF